MKKIVKWVGLGLVGLIVLGLIVDANTSPEKKAAQAAARKQEKIAQAEEEREHARKELAALPSVSASELAFAYEDNTVAADQQYKGKKFKVSGTVVDINTDFTGDPYLTLRGGSNQFMYPHFGFEKSEAAQLAKLRKGSKVTLVCTGKGDIAKTPMSDECILI